MKANKTRKELASEYCEKINKAKSFKKREMLLKDFEEDDERTRVFARHRNMKEQLDTMKVDVHL